MATQGENYVIVEDHIIPQGVLLAALAPLFLILNFPPLIWHLRNRNTAAVFMVFWIMLMNFLSIINVIIWPYIDMRDMYDGQGLCDVEVKLLGGRITGLNAAVLCLLRALAAVLNTDKTLLGPSKAQKRRNTAIELAWCVGLPLLTMVLQYIVQLNRFGLFGVSGCQLMSYSSRTSFVLIWLAPIITNAVAVYYAILVIIRLHKYRSSFHNILSSSNTTRSRFFRLFAISSILILGITPVQIYIIVTQYPHQNLPFNFSKLHNPATWNSSIVMPSTPEMVKWENDKNVYILGAALAALNASITNEIAESVIAGWPTSTLGEAPTLRAVKDQVKKLSSSSPAATTTTATKKSGGKKARAIAAAKGKGKGNKSKKRVRDDESADETAGMEGKEEEQREDDADEQGAAKKQKVVVKQEEVDGDDDEEV
ncbi:STE3-domain-containing protein, partial [Aureobasidium melanogenum]